MTVNPPGQDQSQSSGRGAQQASAPRFARLRRVVRALTWPVRAVYSLLRRYWLRLLLLTGIAAFAFFVVLPRLQEEDVVTVPPQPVEAMRQDLLVTVPATGTLDFGTLVQVGFENAGVLTDLKVSAGEPVTAGDVLALQEADDLTRDIDDAVSALRRAELDLAELLEDLEPDPDVYALRRAELDLAEAHAAFEDLQIPPDAASIASAEASVASARSQVVSARAQVSSARAQVISALDSLDEVLADATDTEIADAASSVTSAEASLVSAQGALSDLLAGAADLEVQKARDNLAAAQEAVVAARRDLDSAVADHPSAVADAEARLATAKATVITASVELHDLRVKPTPEAVRDAEITLEQARLTHDDTVRTGNHASAEVKERAGVAYHEAQLTYLAALEPASPEELAEAESNLAAAEANLAVAQADRDSLATGPDLDALSEAITSAERNEVTAAAELDNLLTGPSSTELATRRANVASAESSLAVARAKLADLGAAVDAGDVRAADEDVRSAEEDVRVTEENVTSALASLADAEAKLADLLAGADASELRQAQLTITRAEIDLADLRADAEPDPDPLAVERLELAVADATRALETARTALADATLISPTTGIILTLDANVGERVSDEFSTVGVSESLRVRINVDENDIGMLEVGQPADLTFAALDDREYKGKVAWIAVQGEVDQGLVTFPVDISLDAPGEHLRAGLTADVEILVAEARNVIVVPKAAVQTTPRGGVVFVAAADGSASRRVVATGLSNRLLVEIVSGLEAGERVMPNAAQAQAEARAAAQAAAAAGGQAGQGGQAGAAQPAAGTAVPNLQGSQGGAGGGEGGQGGPPAGFQGRTPPPGFQPGQVQGQRGQGGQRGQQAGAGGAAGGGGGG